MDEEVALSLFYCFDVAVLEFTTGLKSNFTVSYTHTDETTAKAKLKNRKIKKLPCNGKATDWVSPKTSEA